MIKTNTEKRNLLDTGTKAVYVRQLKKVDNGKLWQAIVKYDSHQISAKALIDFDTIVTGMSTYNVYDLLQIWDELHEDASK